MAKTLVNGLSLLEKLACKEEPASILELASELGLVQSNVHRLLQALMKCGYVRQDPITRRYYSSMRLWELGMRVSWNMHLPSLAIPRMKELGESCRETVHLAVLDGADVLYVHKVDGPHILGLHTRIGGRAPAYCTASGKVLLAFSEDPMAAVPKTPEKHTDKTILSLPQLKALLAQIREQGYAEHDGEWQEDVYSLAAPVFDASGAVQAAIGVAGPLARLEPTKTREVFLPMLIAAANGLSADLGYRRPSVLP